MTITSEQQERIDNVTEKLKSKQTYVNGLHDKLYQLHAVVQSLRNSNNNIHGAAGNKYVEGSIEYLESCLETPDSLRAHVYTEKEKKDRCC